MVSFENAKIILFPLNLIFNVQLVLLVLIQNSNPITLELSNLPILRRVKRDDLSYKPPSNELNLILIGPMFSGKTSAGVKLAKDLGMEFVDSDQEIERRSGMKISEIFKKEGEPGLRKREEEVIHDLTGYKGIVLSTGGGSIVSEKTRTRLMERGLIFYLRITIQDQLARIKKNDNGVKNRPLLDKSSLNETLERLAKERNSLYEEAADVTVSTTGGKENLAAICDEIKKIYTKESAKIVKIV